MVRQLPEAVTDQLQSEFKAFLKTRPDLGPADLAQYTTLAESTVRTWLRGDIPGGYEVCEEMRRVLDQARAGDILQPGGGEAAVVTENVTQRVRRVPRVGKFYETQTVKRISEVLDYCAEQCSIGVITGDFGLGKTEAVKAWRRRNTGKVDSFVFEFEAFSAVDKRYFMVSVMSQLGLSVRGNWQNAGLAFQTVVEHLRKNPCLLIFDQCETLRPQICQIIRQIWDRTHAEGVGVVMLSAPILMARLMAGKMVDLGALTSRVGIWAPLSGLTRPEMAAIVKQEGLSDIEADAFELWFKACAGSMRRVMRSVDLLKARHQGKRISEKTIAGVASMLWGVNLERAA